MGMTASKHCDFSAHDFTATAIETSTGRLIRVTGSGLCPTAGWVLRLQSTNGGVVPHPATLWLELREIPPRRRMPSLRTRTAVEAIIEDSNAREISIRFGWRDPFVVPVSALRQPVGGRRRQGTGASRGRVAASV